MTDDGPKMAMGKSFSENEPGWDEVEVALKYLCKTSLVFCVAGNSGADAMAYPARLSGTIPNVIAVTACDEQGKILNHAVDPDELSGAAEGAVIRRTLSSDHPRYDRDNVYLDPCAAADIYLKVPKGSDAFPQRHIISCDRRGNRGYTPSKYRSTPPTDGPHLELASLFAAFSGTSAATAIAAGPVSPVMQAKGVTDIGKVDIGKLATRGMFGIEEAMDAVE
jgi:subtilisin family serine protease